jgi:hypothetical protein
MKVMAHIREQYSLSLGSYGRPRMTMELKEPGLDVGERRVGRLTRMNGLGQFVRAGIRSRQTVTIVSAWPRTGWLAILWLLHPTRSGPAI